MPVLLRYLILVAVLGATGAAASLGAAEEARPPAVLLTIEVPTVPRPEAVDVVVAPLAGPVAAPGVLKVPISGASTTVPLVLDPSTGWRIEAVAEGYWAPRLTVPQSTGAPLRMTLWRASGVSLALHPAEAADTVPELQLRLGEVAGPPRDGAGLQPRGSQEIICPVLDRRVTACVVPAGHWNLRVDAEGFAPRFSWDLALPGGKTTELGALELKRGGSIVGQLITVEGPADPAQAAVELRPLLELDPTATPEEVAELDQLAVTVPIDSRGNFQLDGVAPGTYVLTARQEGFAPATLSFPVSVEAGALATLGEPLVLERPLRLSLFVNPPMAPDGKRWHLRLLQERGSELMEEVVSAVVDPSGLWESKPLPPGPYILRVLDERGNSLAWQAIDLGPGADEIRLDLPLVFVEGLVTLRDEPLAATLWFGGHYGTEKVEVESDEDGVFVVVLPRDGEWTVDVSAQEPPVAAKGLKVEVETIADLQTAEVVIEVPDTVLLGEVVDELGFPVVSPMVRAMSLAELQGSYTAQADLAGYFEIRGLAQSVYMVEAETADGRSDPIAVRVAEDVEVPVRLVLRAERPMAGRVTSASGPVPHARVQGYPVTSSGQVAAMRLPVTRTDFQGGFRLTVPGSTHSLLLAVLAPGHPLGVRRVAQGESLELVLGSDRGTLELTDTAEAQGKGAVDLVMIQGEPIDLPTLRLWAQMNDHAAIEPSVISVPAMPPGPYAHCRLSVEEAFLVVGGLALPAAGACSEGYLPPGGALRLGPGS